jgi:hypothetical protein
LGSTFQPTPCRSHSWNATDEAKEARRVAARKRNRLSGGVELGLLQGELATKQWTAATEVRLVDEHEGTNTIATIAVELGFPDGVTGLPARAKFPAMDPQEARPKLVGP